MNKESLPLPTPLYPIFTKDGDMKDPSYSFKNDTDTGLFRQDENEISMTTGSHEILRMSNKGLHIKDNTFGDEPNEDPNDAAVLEISSKSRGVLFPRMNSEEASAIVPVDGLIIYVTDTNMEFNKIGFYGRVHNVWHVLHS